MKVGRNKLCPCGSGKKFKRCHGILTMTKKSESGANGLPPEILDAIRKMRSDQAKRQAWPLMYGKVRPAVHITTHDGKKMVAVGANLFQSDTDTTWHGFLYDHLQLCLGRDWFWTEAQKPDKEMHLLVRWFKEVCQIELDDKNQFSLGTPANMTGAILAFRSVAYDLFCLQQQTSLPEGLRDRLKNMQSFEGARYELWIAACFFRAGFEIEFEDETDRRRTHCEFTALYPSNGKKYSVEAKRRHRVVGETTTAYKQNKYIKLGISHLISDAARKHADHTRLIFVDVNMPPQEGGIISASWVKEFQSSKERLEKQKIYRSIDAPRAFIFASNHPYHYLTTEKPDPKTHFFATSFNLPDYYKNPNLIVRDHPAVFELMQSIASHFTIPGDFPP